MNVAIGVVMLLVAFVLIYAGFKGTSPLEEVRKAFGQ